VPQWAQGSIRSKYAKYKGKVFFNKLLHFLVHVMLFIKKLLTFAVDSQMATSDFSFG